jgi:hypothetical protein
MTRTVRNALEIGKAFGPAWLAYRLGYALRLRTGLLRYQLPTTSWEAQPLSTFLRDPALAEPQRYFAARREHRPRFFFTPADRYQYQVLLKLWDQKREYSVNTAEQLVCGVFTYFSHTPVATGCPPAWHRNPFSRRISLSECHWSEIDDFAAGDIKLVWEPNRFSFVYTLVRAYWRTGDERYAELFWQLVEDWRHHNPPQQGVNWKCGQEISFRVMAWCFGLYGFLESVSTTAERVTMLAQMIAVSGQRIAVNLSYALNQNNNHGISEGVGLWTIGLLFPELRAAQNWRDAGRQVLETQGKHLIYDDGAFSQHSVNYHRVMLHDYVWSLRLAELHEEGLPIDLYERLRKATAWLYQIQDEMSGHVPNFGANDGALVLPLTNCDYLDFRPVLQSAHYVTQKTRCYEDGAWNEELLWLHGSEALRAPVAALTRTDLHATDGGHYTLRSPQSFAFVHCGAFRHRPGEADLLHVDLWWRGQNIASDAGTYSYNAPAPWNNSLAHTAHHNTVTVDDLDQMERVNKFLWLPWANGRVRCYSQSLQKTLTYWEGEHDGYARLPEPVSYRRGILRLGEEWWVVIDVLCSAAPHQYRLHWLLCDYPYRWNKAARSLTVRTPAGRYYMQMATLADDVDVSLIHADPEGPRGWRSPYYYSREPAISVDLQTFADSLICWTVFGPQPSHIQQTHATLEIQTDGWRAKVRQGLESNEQDPLIADVMLSGGLRDRLEITSCISS